MRPEAIAVLDSPRSASVLAARSLLRRSGRSERGLFLVEGPQAVREAVASTAGVLELFVTDGAADRHPEIVRDASRGGAVIRECTDKAISPLLETVTPQGMVAVAPLVDVPVDRALAGSPTLVVVGVALSDPGNVGTILRVADAAGADAVLLTAGSVDPHNGKAVRASAGSLFHVPVVTGLRLDEALDALGTRGLRTLATTGYAETDLDDLEDSGGLAGPTAWLLGSEAQGLPDDALTLADASVRIPVHGRAESLNLATAAAVVLYASARAHRRARRS